MTHLLDLHGPLVPPRSRLIDVLKPASGAPVDLGHPRLRNCVALVPLNNLGQREFNLITGETLLRTGPIVRERTYTKHNATDDDAWYLSSSNASGSPLDLQTEATFIIQAKHNAQGATIFLGKVLSGLVQYTVRFIVSGNKEYFGVDWGGQVRPGNVRAYADDSSEEGGWYRYAVTCSSSARSVFVRQQRILGGTRQYGTTTGSTTTYRNAPAVFGGSTTVATFGDFDLAWVRIYNRVLPDAQIWEIIDDPWLEWRNPLPIWVPAAAGAVTKTLQADLDLLAKEQNILKTATLDLISKKLDNLRQADMDIRVLKVNELLADMDLLAKKLDNLKTADMDLLAKTLNNLKQADLDFIVNATKFLEADQDFLAKKLNNLKQADMDLLAKKLDNLEQADLDFLAKQIDILNNVDLDMVVKTLNNLRNADLDLLAKKLDNLKLADLDFIVSAANTITLEADLDFLSKVLDNLKTADLDFLAKTVDNLKTVDLDFIAKTIDNLKLADLDFLAKALDNVNTADLDFLAKTLNNLELVDLDFIVKKTTILEATLDIIVTAGTVLKTATLDLLAKKLDNVKQVDLDFVVFQELILALCSRVTQIAALLAGNVSADNIFSGTMTFGNTLSGGAIADGLLSGETSGGLLTATIDVDTVCN